MVLFQDGAAGWFERDLCFAFGCVFFLLLFSASFPDTVVCGFVDNSNSLADCTLLLNFRTLKR